MSQKTEVDVQLAVTGYHNLRRYTVSRRTGLQQLEQSPETVTKPRQWPALGDYNNARFQ